MKVAGCPVRLGAVSAALLMSLGLAAEVGAVQGTPRSVDEADEFVEQLGAWVPAALEEIAVVPALSVAVVVGDTVVVAEAWGVTDVETGAKASADTQFYIASSTKSFTALMASLLDANDELDLDSPLAEHLHGTELDPALRASDVRLRDFLTHTSGITNGPITYRLAYTGQHDPDVLWRLLASSEPVPDAPLGTYLYSNAGYNILGMIIDRETGHTWQEQLRTRIFEPLGMSRTTAYASRGPREGWSVARPHFGLHPDGLERLDLEKTDATMQSAGGMYTTADDLARWLLFQINDGELGGEQLVDAALVRATHERLVLTESSDGTPFEQTGYGLGWSHGSFRGHTVISHGGGYPGFRSMISFMPEERIGVAVMTNEGSIGSGLLQTTLHQCYDWWLGEIDDFDLGPVEGFSARRVQATAGNAASLADRAKRTWQLSRARDAYVGRFENPLAGTLELVDSGGQFVVSVGNLRCTATPFPAPETMRLELVPRRGTVARFDPPEGPVSSIWIDGDTYTRVE